MHLLVISYTVPQMLVQPHVESHFAWVKKYFEDGIFVAAGPKKDKTGGVIIAKSIDTDKLNTILEEDSFVSQEVAKYDIIDMECKLAVSALEELKAI
jgi:uncharacterized protein YciI